MKTVLDRRFLAALLAALVLPVAAQEIATEAGLRAILEKRLEAETQPACAVAAFVGEKTVLARSCSAGASAPGLTPDALVEIGSVSKAIVALVLADMVERDELALDAAAASIAPKDAKLPRKDDRDIRLRDLVTQTSGLPRLPPGFAPKDPADPYADFDVAALYRALARTDPARAPGAGYEYSNFGFMWLSELLGRRAGSDFASLARARVFAPLGMKDTAVRLPPEAMARLAPGHDAARRVVPPWSFAPELAGVGGVRATTNDMVKLAQALAGRAPGPLEAAIERSRERLYTSPRGQSLAYAWNLIARPAGTVYWHNGGTGGFRAMLVFSRETRRAAWVVSDSTAALDDLALHLVDGGLPLKAKRVAVSLGAEALEDYVGAYELSPGFVLAVTREGERLFTQATGQGRIEAFAEAKDRFFVREVDAQLEFRRDGAGRVESVVLKQGGRDFPGRRQR